MAQLIDVAAAVREHFRECHEEPSAKVVEPTRQCDECGKFMVKTVIQCSHAHQSVHTCHYVKRYGGFI